MKRYPRVYVGRQCVCVDGDERRMEDLKGDNEVDRELEKSRK